MDEKVRRGRSRRAPGMDERRHAPHRRGRRVLPVVFALAVLAAAAAGCFFFRTLNAGPEIPRESSVSVEPETMQAESDAAREEAVTPEMKIQEMTLEEKVLQLFMITPEALTGVSEVYVASDTTREAVHNRPVGGIVYFEQNLKDEEQTKDMLTKTRSYFRERLGIEPLLGVDEEGGQVARISGRAEFALESFPDMAEIGASEQPERAGEIGSRIGVCLSELGFNLDFAPVADVLTNPENTVVVRRSFGSDPAQVSEFVNAYAEGLRSQGITAVLKHFPGHGGTAGDSHDGYAQTDRSLEQMRETEFVPFREGIESGIQVIMAGHISAPSVTEDELPASLSYKMITEILREELGFDGVIITDAMNMGAITEKYSSSEAAVKAIEAGCDMILMPENFEEAYQGVLDSVRQGRLTEERINQSVMRILEIKDF